MILNSPMPVPERILLYGQPGTGKSRAALSVARILGPDQTMHVVDTDYSASYERLLWTEFTDVAEQGNIDVTVVDSDDWVGTITAVKEKAEAAEKGDWLSSTRCPRRGVRSRPTSSPSVTATTSSTRSTVEGKRPGCRPPTPTSTGRP